MSKPELIGLTGGPGAGKDLAASFLAWDFGYRVIGYSDALRDFLYATDPGFRMAVDLHGYTEAKARVEGVRDRLIEVGNAARTWISPSIWRDAVDTRIAEARTDNVVAVVTGVRYRAEADMIREAGGLVVGIDRPAVVFELDEYRETFLASDVFIPNHGTVREFQEEISSLLART